MDTRIYSPSFGLATWRSRLADPETQWRRGKSAFETAVFWENGARQTRGIDHRLAAVLDQDKALRGCELVASFPEHRVALPGGSRASQTDVWSILRSEAALISLAVEGKAGESFAQTIGEWRSESSPGKDRRLAFLCAELGLAEIDDAIRYQVVHRAASALIEARRIGATASVMVVLSFAEDVKSKAGFTAFVNCCCREIPAGPLIRATSTPRPLFLAWLDIPPCSDADIAAIAT